MPSISVSLPDGRMVDRETATFWASWQTPEAALEDVDTWVQRNAIAWGRDRADVVMIRLGHTGDTYFSAGLKHETSPDDPAEPIPTWPPAESPPEGWFTPNEE